LDDADAADAVSALSDAPPGLVLVRAAKFAVDAAHCSVTDTERNHHFRIVPSSSGCSRALAQ
jgi:hypothetical protein